MIFIDSDGVSKTSNCAFLIIFGTKFIRNYRESNSNRIIIEYIIIWIVNLYINDSNDIKKEFFVIVIIDFKKLKKFMVFY